MSVYRSPLDAPRLRWTPWEGVTTLSTSDSYDYSTDAYITSVTHNGDGNYSIGIDRSYNRTFPSRAARLYFDVYDGWSINDWYDRLIQIRITMTTDYSTKSVSPYIGVLFYGGAKDVVTPTGFAMLRQQFVANSGMVVMTNIGAAVSSTVYNDDTNAEIQQGVFTVAPAAMIPGQQAPAIRPETFTAGYNDASGYTTALILKQLTAGSGTETIGVTVEKRYLAGLDTYW